MKLLLDLFFTFAKVGMFTFGGGYAMISIIENICVEQKKWITHEEMMDMTVIAESTPGPIAINAATYVGYKHAGIPGSILATVGMVAPSFVVIYLISSMLDNFLEIQWIANAFKGIKIGVGLLILRVAIQMCKKLKPKPQPRIIAGCAFAVMLAVNFLSLKFSTITLMLISGAVGLGIFLIKERKGGGAK
jgi:chromate transporter